MVAPEKGQSKQRFNPNYRKRRKYRRLLLKDQNGRTSIKNQPFRRRFRQKGRVSNKATGPRRRLLPGSYPALQIGVTSVLVAATEQQAPRYSYGRQIRFQAAQSTLQPALETVLARDKEVDGDGVGGYVALLIFFAAFTVFLNCLLLFCIFTTKTLRTTTNYFVASLTIANIFVGLFIMPCVTLLETKLASGTAGVVLCEIKLFLQLLSCMITVLSILGISAIRFIAVVHPLFYKTVYHQKLGFWLPILAWLITIATTAPRIILRAFQTNSHDSFSDECSAGSITDVAPSYVPLMLGVFIVGNVVSLILILLLRRSFEKRGKEVVERRYSLAGSPTGPHGDFKPMATSSPRLGTAPSSDLEASSDWDVRSNTASFGAQERRKRWVATAIARRKIEKDCYYDCHNNGVMQKSHSTNNNTTSTTLPSCSHSNNNNTNSNNNNCSNCSSNWSGSGGLDTIWSNSQCLSTTDVKSPTPKLDSDESSIKMLIEPRISITVPGKPPKLSNLGPGFHNKSAECDLVLKSKKPPLKQSSFDSRLSVDRNMSDHRSLSPQRSVQSIRDVTPMTSHSSSQTKIYFKSGSQSSYGSNKGDEHLVIHRPKSPSPSFLLGGSFSLRRPSAFALDSRRPSSTASSSQLTATNWTHQLRSVSSLMNSFVSEQTTGDEVAKQSKEQPTQTHNETYSAHFTKNNYGNHSMEAKPRLTTVTAKCFSSESSNTPRRSDISTRALSSVSFAIDGIVGGFSSEGAKATAILFILIVFFVICQLPLVTVDFVNFVCSFQSSITACVPSPIHQTAMWMLFIYSAFSPIVFFSFNQHLRTSLWSSFSVQRPKHLRHTTSFPTRNGTVRHVPTPKKKNNFHHEF